MEGVLPARFLERDRKFLKVKLLELVVLLYHVHRGAADTDIGFEDAGQTIQQLTQKLDREVWVDPANLESALWSCNLMNEKVAFWHPWGYSFDAFVRELLGPLYILNPMYHLIMEKKK